MCVGDVCLNCGTYYLVVVKVNVERVRVVCLCGDLKDIDKCVNHYIENKHKYTRVLGADVSLLTFYKHFCIDDVDWV